MPQMASEVGDKCEMSDIAFDRFWSKLSKMMQCLFLRCAREGALPAYFKDLRPHIEALLSRDDSKRHDSERQADVTEEKCNKAWRIGEELIREEELLKERRQIARVGRDTVHCTCRKL